MACDADIIDLIGNYRNRVYKARSKPSIHNALIHAKHSLCCMILAHIDIRLTVTHSSIYSWIKFWTLQ